MKKKGAFIAIAFVLAVTGAIIGKANTKFVDVRYKETVNGSTSGCLFPHMLPPNCIIESTQQVCTVVISPIQSRTLYQDPGCAIYYYRQQ